MCFIQKNGNIQSVRDFVEPRVKISGGKMVQMETARFEREKGKNMGKPVVQFGRVIVIGGAFIGLLIGSGFTTGQEIMQYFVSFGWMGIAATIMMFIGYVYIGLSLVSVGAEQRFKEPRHIYQYYCGKKLGTFFDWFGTAFQYMSFWVMVSGAGAAVNQQFGLPNWVGGLGLALLTIVVLFFGFSKLVDIVGSIGPVVSCLAIALGIAGICMNPEGLATFAEDVVPLVTDGTIKQAGSNWFTACASYLGFCLFWLATFMTNVGAEANSKKEAGLGAIFGSGLYSVAVLILMFGLAANVTEVGGQQIPTLVLATKIFPALGIIYTIIVFTEIFTTAGPLLWSPCKRLCADEKSKKYRLLLVCLGLVGTLVGLFVPFDALINVVYVLNGYVGFIFLGLMVITDIRVRIMKKHTPAIVKELEAAKQN